MGEAIGIVEVVKYILIGLGIVFFALLVLVNVFNMQGITKIFFKFDSEGISTDEESIKVTTSAEGLTETMDEKQLTAAIAAALQYHDNTNKQIAAAITAAILHHNNKGE